MKTNKTRLSWALVILFMTGCTLMQGDNRTALFLIDQGISRFIEAEEDPVKRAQRAQDTIAVVQPVFDLASGETTTVSALEAKLYEQFDMDSLEPSDQRLIKFLVDDVKASLFEGVQDGIVNEQTRLLVREVLSTVLNAALVYR